jgi:hypothetical protein
MDSVSTIIASEEACDSIEVQAFDRGSFLIIQADVEFKTRDTIVIAPDMVEALIRAVQRGTRID